MTAIVLSRTHPLLLGSGSPRRREFLELLGIPFVVASLDVDESVNEAERATDYVERICRSKLRAASKVAPSECLAILVADTTVALGEEILGKPRDREDALRMISQLSGLTHRVMTCYGIRLQASGEEVVQRVTTLVEMRAIGEEELLAYADSGEGLDKAGAYAIQGRAAAFVRSIHGSYTNVVGLPLCELQVDLSRLGLLGCNP